MAASVYQRILGARFATLDAPVRALHSLRGHHRLRGRCSIVGAQGRLGRAIAALVGLPRPCSDTDFVFEIEIDDDGETWIRHFPRRAMRSRLRAGSDGLLHERLGITTLRFRLEVKDGRLSMHLANVRVGGIAWPRAWLPEVWALEHGEDGRFHFDVGARLGRIGTLVAYRGHLDLADTEHRA